MRCRCILIGLLLAMVCLSGCDWGHRSHTFPYEFARVDRQVAEMYGGTPTTSSQGFSLYGSDEPPRPAFLVPNQDSMVEVKDAGTGKTKVKIRVRSSSWFMFTERNRLPEKEEEFLSRLEQQLQAQKDNSQNSPNTPRSWENTRLIYSVPLAGWVGEKPIEVVGNAKKKLMGIIQAVSEDVPSDVADRQSTIAYFACGERELAWKGEYLVESPLKHGNSKIYRGQFLLELLARWKDQHRLSETDLGYTEENTLAPSDSGPSQTEREHHPSSAEGRE